MNISKWLDKKEVDGFDVSQIVLPADSANDEAPDETIYFKEINMCGVLYSGNHPFSTVERFGHWYYSWGRDKEHCRNITQPQLWIFTKDQELAIKTEKDHIK